MKKKCQSIRIISVYPEYKEKNPCGRKAVTSRDNFRWGQGDEPQIVDITVPLCQECANNWDDSMAVGRAEAC